MPGDVISSNDADYVMSRIGQLHLQDSTVTMVMIGNETWSRRFVDWELQASLRQRETGAPNGLLGIRLLSYRNADYPNRLHINLLPLDRIDCGDDCYARVYSMPQSAPELRRYIEDAFDARTARCQFIDNPRDRMRYNRQT